MRKALDYAGVIMIDGMISADSAALSLVDNKQIVDDGDIDQLGVAADPNIVGDKGTSHVNEASLTSSIDSAAGNVGVNASAGDQNLQENAAAISAISGVTAGSSDAEVFSVQKGINNDVLNSGVVNDTDVDTSITNIDGNAGVNIATGAAHIQKNALAISNVTGSAVLSEATAAILQESTFNTTNNTTVSNTTTVNASITTIAGNLGVNATSGSGNIQNNTLAIGSAQ